MHSTCTEHLRYDRHSLSTGSQYSNMSGPLVINILEHVSVVGGIVVRVCVVDL